MESIGGRIGGSWDARGAYTFINMVTTRVENGSPDMIPTAFDRKFDETKDEIPPGIYRPHILKIIQYWGWED